MPYNKDRTMKTCNGPLCNGKMRPVEVFSPNKTRGPNGLQSWCRECDAAHYEVNKEQILARQAAYKAANKERIAAYNAAYRAAHKEERAAYSAAYHAANYKRNKAELLDFYGPVCRGCHEPLSVDAEGDDALEFHHIDPFNKNFCLPERFHHYTDLANASAEFWYEVMACIPMHKKCHKKAHQDLAKRCGLKLYQYRQAINEIKADLRGDRMKRKAKQKEKICSKD